MERFQKKKTHWQTFLLNHSFLIRGTIYALMWFFTESMFRSLLITDPQGNMSVEISLRFLYPSMLPGAAIAGLLIFEPIYVHIRFHDNPWINRLTRYLIVYPLGIWLFEIIYGACLFNFFNQTRAWQYFGDYAFFNGYINLKYYILWAPFSIPVDWMLGLMVKMKLLKKAE